MGAGDRAEAAEHASHESGIVRAFLVVGPESSGTKLATRLLMAAGCKGDCGHRQRFDVSPPDGEDPVVWRRSMPHGHPRNAWPDIADMVLLLRKVPYEVSALVTTRDWRSMVMSHVHDQQHARSAEEAERLIREAYTRIFVALSLRGVPWWTLSYEALVARPREVGCATASLLGLPRPVPFEVRDGNEKYYA